LVSGLKKPRSTIEKLTTQIPEVEKSTKPDRPRKYCSAKERQAEYRREKKQSRSNEILQLNDFPYPIKKRCGSENTSIIGYEMSIDIVPHFVTHHGPCGTF
jgi:hypothetical protein